MLVWLAMITGAHRGELCALRWDAVDLTAGVLTIRSSIAQRSARTWEKDTKTHQQRRITIDPDTLTLLRAFRRYCAQRIGFDDMPGSAFIFSNARTARRGSSPTRSASATPVCAPAWAGT
jgi:integrase